MRGAARPQAPWPLEPVTGHSLSKTLLTNVYPVLNAGIRMAERMSPAIRKGLGSTTRGQCLGTTPYIF